MQTHAVINSFVGCIIMFKICNRCGKQWITRNQFLSDADIKFIGYQVHFDELELGLFLFIHSCKSSLSVYAKSFTDLYCGEIFLARKTGEEECPGFCLKKRNLSVCPAKCECAYIREIVRLIDDWSNPKKTFNLSP